MRGDDTNYWIFTEGGLRNLIERADWEVYDVLRVRDDESLLWGAQTDERVICLLRSRRFPPEPRTQLAEGWHVLENGAWRWTMRRFSILAAPGVRTVRLKVTVPEVLAIPVTMTGPGASHVLSRRGDHECVFTLPDAAEERVIEFEVNRVLPPDEQDGRERGIVVRAVDVFTEP